MTGRHCVIVGAGAEAAHKAKCLLAAGAKLRVIAPVFLPTQSYWESLGVTVVVEVYCGLHEQPRPFLVVAATNEKAVNARVACDARALGALVVRVDEPNDSDFAFSATPRRGRLSASGTTDGGEPSGSEPRDTSTPKVGRVSLVGAGPGDPELLTLKGAMRLREADVVVHDDLVTKDIMDCHATGARRINVGKRKGVMVLKQEEINALLVSLVREGFKVVRLKGGDPCLFGRAEEERKALAQAGFPCEIVSGVSNLSAVPAAAGIVVTNRDNGRSVGAFSLHKRDGKRPTDAEWAQMANGPDTLVLFMGRTILRETCERLIQEGRAPETPAVLIINGTLPEQHVVRGTLSTLPDEAALVTTAGPWLIVVGEVAGL